MQYVAKCSMLLNALHRKIYITVKSPYFYIFSKYYLIYFLFQILNIIFLVEVSCPCLETSMMHF